MLNLFKKVVHFSPGNSIFKESNSQNLLWRLHCQRVAKFEELIQFLHHQDEFYVCKVCPYESFQHPWFSKPNSQCGLENISSEIKKIEE